MGAAQSREQLVRLQRVAKARCEMEVAELVARQTAVDDENAYLREMQARRFETGGNLVPESIIVERLDRNSRLSAQLTADLADRKRALLQSSRTLEILEQKVSVETRASERMRDAAAMDEYVASLAGRAKTS